MPCVTEALACWVFLATPVPQTAVTGVVRDSVDLEPIAFASVAVESPPGSGVIQTASADQYGAFVVSGVSAAGSALVRVEALGYSPWEREYQADELVDDLRILLAREPITLQGVEVAAHRAGDPLAASPGVYRIDAEVVRAQPVVLETDVLRATVLSASASPSSDWVSLPFVRGGTSEGTPVLLDGVRLFNPFHVAGFVSALNAEAVKSVSLVTGSSRDALSVGSLSGAIDIATRDGARDRFHASGSLGMASSRLTAEGPIGESVSYLVDARRTYIDLVSDALAGIGLLGSGVPYSFGDIHSKLTADFGDIRRLSVTGYWNAELLDSRPEDVPQGDDALSRAHRTDWGNGALSVHYRDRIGEGTLIDMAVGYSRFRGAYIIFEDKTHDSDTATVVNAKMAEYRTELKLQYHAGRLTVDGGLQATRSEGVHRALGSEWDGSDEDGLVLPFDLSASVERFGAYVGAVLPVARGVSAGGGFRADAFLGVAGTLSPYAEVSYDATDWKAWLSASRSHQALASLRNEEPGLASYLAFDMLAPVEEGPVPRNTAVSIGWDGRISVVKLRLEAYARRLDNLRLPPLDSNPFESPVLVAPSLREIGTGSASGLEASWTWTSDRVGVLGSYRWSRVSRTVAGRKYTPRFHRDHEGELSASLTRGQSLWSLRFSARSGQPTTPIAAFVPFVGHRFPDASDLQLTYDVLNLAGEYNSVSLPPYFRVDLGWRGSWDVGWFGGGNVSPYFSIANLFSLPNVVGAAPSLAYGRTDRAAADGGASELVYGPQLPMLPFFGVEFRF